MTAIDAYLPADLPGIKVGSALRADAFRVVTASSKSTSDLQAAAFDARDRITDFGCPSPFRFEAGILDGSFVRGRQMPVIYIARAVTVLMALLSAAGVAGLTGVFQVPADSVFTHPAGWALVAMLLAAAATFVSIARLAGLRLERDGFNQAERRKLADDAGRAIGVGGKALYAVDGKSVVHAVPYSRIGAVTISPAWFHHVEFHDLVVTDRDGLVVASVSGLDNSTAEDVRQAILRRIA